MLKRLRIATREPRAVFRRWRSSYAIMNRFPGIYLELPSNWSYDDLSAIDVQPGVSIGLRADIQVLRSSPASPIPGSLSIGANCFIGSGITIRANGGAVIIGANCLLAQNVTLIASNHLLQGDGLYGELPWDSKRSGVLIGQNVWVAGGCTILPGASIGDNSVVAAGGIVTGQVPANQLWAGVPARFMRELPRTNK